MAFRFRPNPPWIASEVLRWMEEVRLWFSYMFGRTTVADDNYTTNGDYRVSMTALTSARTITIRTRDIQNDPSSGLRSPIGREFVFNDESGAAATHNITIATEGSETINGASTATISTNYGSLRLYSDGSNLFTTE